MVNLIIDFFPWFLGFILFVFIFYPLLIIKIRPINNFVAEEKRKQHSVVVKGKVIEVVRRGGKYSNNNLVLYNWPRIQYIYKGILLESFGYYCTEEKINVGDEINIYINPDSDNNIRTHIPEFEMFESYNDNLLFEKILIIIGLFLIIFIFAIKLIN